jgi:hypothetical protein
VFGWSLSLPVLILPYQTIQFLRARAYNVGMKLFTRSEVEEELLKTVPVYGKRGRPSRVSVARVSRKLKKTL